MTTKSAAWRGEKPAGCAASGIRQPLVLASASPARKALLTQCGITHIVHPADIEENSRCSEPHAYVMDLSQQKIEAVLHSEKYLRTHPVLAADTCIWHQQQIIGKCETADTAAELIRSFSGTDHSVLTGISFYNPQTGNITTAYAETSVTFFPLTGNLIDWYINSEEWRHAAGAYRIQGRASVFIKALNGSFWNVVGLPLELFFGILRTQDCQYVVLDA